MCFSRTKVMFLSTSGVSIKIFCKEVENKQYVEYDPELKTKSSGSVKKYSKVYNQGPVDASSANAFCAAYRLLRRKKDKFDNFEPSRAYFHFKEKIIERGGTEFYNSIDYVRQRGICSEKIWRYTSQNLESKPPPFADDEAVFHKIKDYKYIKVDDTTVSVIEQLLTLGNPVIAKFCIHESFEQITQNGMVKIPKESEECIGEHNMVIVGYTRSKKLFTVLNSRDLYWGHRGYCYIHYDHISNPELVKELITIYI